MASAHIITLLFPIVGSRYRARTADAISRCPFDHGADFGCGGRPSIARHPRPKHSQRNEQAPAYTEHGESGKPGDVVDEAAS